ncbi:hypothetical protein INT43_003134 [Umbelopsis isabellina]|uniref:Uncharacterized protein n=1 Tax=Mortierella isabellina TaxID=91625 RepID=A0A8H7PPL8_MORIS|nr:hypothetical protein INT43_003134 [Umbelopsis isabellina]
MPVDAARAKVREVERSLEQQLFIGEGMSVNSGIERRTATPVHLRGPIPHGNRGYSPANAQALPSRDPRLAHYPSGFGERLAGSNGASHLAPKDMASNGNYQNQNRMMSRATATVNNETLSQGQVVNAKGNSGHSLRNVRHPMDRGPASVPSQPVPAKLSLTGSSSNAIPRGASKMPGNANVTSVGGTSKPKNANATPLGRPNSPASTSANSVTEPSKSASANGSFLNAPNIPDHDLEILHPQNSVNKKRVISSGPPSSEITYQHALATLKSGIIDWRDTYITHVDFIFETDEFPPPPQPPKPKKKKLSSNTASPAPSQPKKQPEDNAVVNEDTHQPKTVIATPKNAALAPLPAQVQPPASSPRSLSTIARTSQKLDVEEVVDLGSASMQNAIHNTARMIRRILEGPYIYMSLSRFEREYRVMQASKAPSLTLPQLRANYDHPAMAGYFDMAHYPANALAKFICLPFRHRPSQTLPENTRMHRFEMFDLDASYCVFPGTTININCLMFLLNTIPGRPPSGDDYMKSTVDELFEYLANRSAHLWSISSYDQGNRLLLDFDGRRE